MSLISWTAEQFGTQVASHDQEHQQIFSQLNELHATVPGGDRAAIGSKLDALIATVGEHFSKEEDNMIKCSYSGLDEHKAQHDALVRQCTDLQKQFHAGSADITTETTGFIKDWLTGHIPSTDRGYSEPFKAQGIN